MAKYLVGVVAVIIWMFIMRVLKKSELHFWRFIIGAAGLFIFGIIYVRPVLTQPLAQVVALLATIPGRLLHMYTAHYKYGVIFINSAAGAISLRIDFECSGIIEILAYVSLLVYFRVYTVYERIYVGVLGVIGILFANVFRIILICVIIYFGGVNMYHIAHTYVGRIFFYALSVTLYFYVFTKPQIIKQKVGNFSYDAH